MLRKSWKGVHKVASRNVSTVFTVTGRSVHMQKGIISKEMWLTWLYCSVFLRNKVIPETFWSYHAAFFSFIYKNVYQFTYTKQKALHNSKVHRSLQNCVFSLWNLLHVTLLAPRIWRWRLDFWQIGASLELGEGEEATFHFIHFMALEARTAYSVVRLCLWWQRQ